MLFFDDISMVMLLFRYDIWLPHRYSTVKETPLPSLLSLSSFFPIFFIGFFRCFLLSSIFIFPIFLLIYTALRLHFAMFFILLIYLLSPIAGQVRPLFVIFMSYNTWYLLPAAEHHSPRYEHTSFFRRSHARAFCNVLSFIFHASLLFLRSFIVIVSFAIFPPPYFTIIYIIMPLHQQALMNIFHFYTLLPTIRSLSASLIFSLNKLA